MQARIVALAVSQEHWGALPGASFSVVPAPIHEDVVQVALSGGVVQRGSGPGGAVAGGCEDNEESDAECRGDEGSGGGGGDSGDGFRAAREGGVLWLSLPFVAALLPGASPDTRRQAAMSINIALKVREAYMCTMCICVYVYLFVWSSHILVAEYRCANVCMGGLVVMCATSSVFCL